MDDSSEREDYVPVQDQIKEFEEAIRLLSTGDYYYATSQEPEKPDDKREEPSSNE